MGCSGIDSETYYMYVTLVPVYNFEHAYNFFLHNKDLNLYQQWNLGIAPMIMHNIFRHSFNAFIQIFPPWNAGLIRLYSNNMHI